jgi:hypothetical protein
VQMIKWLLVAAIGLGFVQKASSESSKLFSELYAGSKRPEFYKAGGALETIVMRFSRTDSLRKGYGVTVMFFDSSGRGVDCCRGDKINVPWTAFVGLYASGPGDEASFLVPYSQWMDKYCEKRERTRETVLPDSVSDAALRLVIRMVPVRDEESRAFMYELVRYAFMRARRSGGSGAFSTQIFDSTGVCHLCSAPARKVGQSKCLLDYHGLGEAAIFDCDPSKLRK